MVLLVNATEVLRTVPILDAPLGLIRANDRTVTPQTLYAMTPSATRVNVTVDDLYPDPHTRQSIIFDNGNWNIGQHCQQCAFQLDPIQTYRGSWHDITFDPTHSDFNSTATATFSFTGTFCAQVCVLFI